MLKTLILALALSLTGFAAQAEEIQCPADGADVLAMIEKQDSCYMAAKVARECAWGSSFDVQLAGAASEMCTKSIAKWPKRHRKMRTELLQDCVKKWSKEEGTLARSAHAHCNLNIDELFWSLNEPAGT